MTSHPGDHERVRELLGREPQGQYVVVVRSATGDPIVIRNAPLLDDGTPMPTRFWLVGTDEVRRIGRLESEGGVAAAVAAVDPGELESAHARYATERDSALRADHRGPRPSGGVGGTRNGVKCLHAHWAWYLAGGDDPVAAWIATRLAAETADHIETSDAIAGTRVTIADDRTTVRLADGGRAVVPWGAVNLTERWLEDGDPPRPEALTNALGTIADHLDDIVRDHPAFVASTAITFAGPTIGSLARLEVGARDIPATHTLDRDAAEEVFRIVATEPAYDRVHNPGLPSHHVEVIVATCCIVLAFMRRLHLDTVTLHATPDTVGLDSPGDETALEPSGPSRE